MVKYLITGGAGFIGSAVIRYLVNDLSCEVVNLDKLTYAGNLDSLAEVVDSPNYIFEKVDVCDLEGVQRVFEQHHPDKIMHLAAESHVDRSIDVPAEFIQTNIVGTFVMLQVALQYWLKLPEVKKEAFRFHHISTDEVYGDLEGADDLFTETTSYAPSSPYAASKASSDHLVRAWNRTYGLPMVITNCSNNYGPYQFPEKLVPLVIINAIGGKALPVYGTGNQIRDWLHVEDHARALVRVAKEGIDGETYNIGGHNEKTNLEVVKEICRTLDELLPNHPSGVERYEDLVVYVADRPGHDVRYAIDASKVERELNWCPVESFETGIRKTVEWYLNNKTWWQRVQDGGYQGERLGLGVKS